MIRVRGLGWFKGEGVTWTVDLRDQRSRFKGVLGRVFKWVWGLG